MISNIYITWIIHHWKAYWVRNQRLRTEFDLKFSWKGYLMGALEESSHKLESLDDTT